MLQIKYEQHFIYTSIPRIALHLLWVTRLSHDYEVLGDLVHTRNLR